MKLLVFGNSDTRGAAVSGPTWTELVRRGLELRGELEFVDRNFVPLGERAPEFAERMVVEIEPDVVLLPLSEYVFWAVSVELQVKHRLGARAAAAFKSAERRLDRAARGKPGVRGATHRAMQGFARRAVGTRAPASAKAVAETYSEVLRRLARIESLEVVVVSYPFSPLPSLQTASMRKARASFIAQVRQTAEHHHLHWVSGDDLVATAGLSVAEAYAADGVHIGEASHPLFAVAVLEALGVRPTVNPP
ncbi:MAG: hypothetical protein ABI577_07245 [bacterium]